MELGRLIGPELTELLEQDPAQIADLTEDLHPQDIAEAIEQLDDEVAARAIRALPEEYAAQVFQRLPEDRQVTISSSLGTEDTAELVTEMHADDAADFFGLLSDETAEQILGRLRTVDPEVVHDVEELTRWPDDSAGGLMNNWFVEVRESATIERTLSELRAQAAEGVEVLDIVFVTDDASVVVGFVTLRRLLMSKAEVIVTEVMNRNLVSVPPDMHQEEVARTFSRYDFNSLPVVDVSGKILGVITADDVIDVVEEEALEDAQKMGAVEPMESAYLSVPFWTYYKKRAPWLMVLFVGGFFTTSAMEAFSPILRSLTHLAFYVPLLISAGGNSGSQSATLVIRGLAVDELSTSDWWRVLLRELAQGIILGMGLALLGMLRAWIGGDGAQTAMVVGVTLIAIVVLGCVVGAMMPLLLVRVGLDPATSSTPFIASLVDVLGIVVYLGLARLLLTGSSTMMTPP